MSQDVTPKGLARRKLVRGVFAAPAVLTLSSGSALAASSNMTCLRNQNNTAVAAPITTVNPNPSQTAPVITTTQGDKYLRYRLLQATEISTGTVKYAVLGSDLSALVRNNQQPFVANGSAQLVDITSNALSGGSMPANGTGYKNIGRSNQYIALRIDATGAVVGVGRSNGGSAVAATCWNSFAASTR